MARNKGNLEDCIAHTRHHVAPHKAGLMAAGRALNLKGVSYRFALVDANLQVAQGKIREIREAAKKGDCAAVLKALDDEIEFGHNF